VFGAPNRTMPPSVEPLTLYQSSLVATFIVEPRGTGMLTVFPWIKDSVQAKDMPSDHLPLPAASWPSSPQGLISLLVMVAFVQALAPVSPSPTWRQLQPRGFIEATWSITKPV
jgi:hypothetical protein